MPKLDSNHTCLGVISLVSALKKDDNYYLQGFLTLFRMGFFGAAHGWGRLPFWPSLPKIFHTYPTMMKLGKVIPYLSKTQKIYKSRDTSAGISIFFWQKSADFASSGNKV